MHDTEEHFKTTVSRDLLALCCGDHLGSGVGRDVYVFNPNPEWVIKFETTAGSFQNIREYESWWQVAGTEFVSWLAPVHFISPCGTVLLQSKTTPIQEGMYPEHIPAVFTDIARRNWGLLNGRPVCHDYGFLLTTFNLKKTKKVRW